ncbi:hypothetical protein L226DRAFT_373093 [Lentinus tigrinus ALCF2SS1-7]|uniref:Uncharacterized protein n=1 Tax=Lentinus tigrinus ALCF2SS1-6 TaxID=1328759 RepID=A0A5C2SLT5_9APHY|nr:hypothetical protein L227DRAFT_571694 [Lentinus tigrinus ALCF2SS1-6]RPD76319.1 hypothetical protein L226DRAFT_373093 [Lentinus tigrinus ALCF2SS1-7]
MISSSTSYHQEVYSSLPTQDHHIRAQPSRAIMKDKRDIADLSHRVETVMAARTVVPWHGGTNRRHCIPGAGVRSARRRGCRIGSMKAPGSTVINCGLISTEDSASRKPSSAATFVIERRESVCDNSAILALWHVLLLEEPHGLLRDMHGGVDFEQLPYGGRLECPPSLLQR